MLNAGERKSALNLLLRGISRTLDETGARFPLYREAGGDWVTTVDGNWCAGYWIGLLWLAARHSPPGPVRQRFLDAAYDHLPPLLAQPGGHIFAGLNHCYAGFLGYDTTGDPKLREIGVRGADLMLELYDAKARQIPIGVFTTAPPNAHSREGPVDRRNLAAVDVVHTSLPVLWRAFAETGREEYREVARAHVARHLEWHMRADGSTTQITAFDRATGQRLRTYNTLAASDDGCWSRGLGWHVAGLANDYVESGEAAALAAVRRSMVYYAAKSGPDLVPPWDFAMSEPSAERDASAAAIAAHGLISMRSRRGEATARLEGMGAAILESLLRNYLVRDPAAPNAGAVLHGCYRRPQLVAIDAELIWTDFYVMAALDLQEQI